MSRGSVMTKLLRRSRGSTLVEVMAASVVLLIGMTGIIALLIRGMAAHREVNVELRALNHANSIAAQLGSLDYASVSVIPAGVVTWVDQDDQRRYQTSTTITEVGDGGVRAARIEVRAQWISNMGDGLLRQPVDAVAVAIVSEAPDAN
jgi:hypothetical protein